MVDAILPVRVCRKCEESNFYPSGTCKTCSQAYARAHKEKIKAYQAEYRASHVEEATEKRRSNAQYMREYGKAYRAANAEILRAKAARWQRANRDRLNAARNARRAKDRAKTNMLFRVWRQANRHRLNAEKRADYALNSRKYKSWAERWKSDNAIRYKEIQRAAGRRFYLANRERLIANRVAWARQNPEKARIVVQNRRARKSGGKLSAGLAQKLLRLQRGKCACCGKRLGSNYHMDHIVPLALGGEHADRNIQLLTATCNMRKNAKAPEQYMRELGFLL